MNALQQTALETAISTMTVAAILLTIMYTHSNHTRVLQVLPLHVATASTVHTHTHTLSSTVVWIVLLVMWKFCNDAFYCYVYCCASGGSRSAMHSLQQENQRLRQELSQNKMSFSGRYSLGQFSKWVIP